VRARYNIAGHVLWDIMAALGMWPQVLCQMEMQFLMVPTDKLDDDSNYEGVKKDDFALETASPATF
jgi:hypothetical protein